MSERFELLRSDNLVQPLRPILRRPQELKRVKTFRVASYNVYNLFGKYSDRPAQPAQLNALGQMILSLDADVISFAEVQNEFVIRSLFQQHVNPSLKEEQKYDAFVSIPANDRRGINVALVTRLSVRGVMTFHDREFGASDGPAVRFSRDLLGVEIQATPDYRFLYFATHLKSKIGGQAAEERRGMEADEVVTILSEPTFGGTPFIEQDMILAGDMNDDPDSRVIGILKADGRLDDELENVDPNFTYPTHTRYKKTRLDYLFTSSSMARRMSELAIHRDPPAAEASDHYPVSGFVRAV
jgi:endonuclease/exonuclease/phosphatase family metal-dependent hydrolase